MPPTRRSPRRLHPALSVLFALALHAGVFVALRGIARVPSGLALPLDTGAQVEISLLPDPVEPAHPETREPSADARAPSSGEPAAPASPATTSATSAAATSAMPARSAARARSRSAARDDLAVIEPPLPPSADGPAAPSDELSATPGSGTAAAGSAPAPSINLGLNDGVRRAALLGGWLEPLAPPPKTTDGGLKEGLAARDAQRGQSLSNPANRAGYEAARLFAPKAGMGVFDILTDEQGLVLSVTLAGAPSDEARWQRVGQELEQLLKARRLRVPAGAKGLEARLRIETGDFALDSAERGRTPRGAGLGQSALHPRQMQYESTRASLEPGVLSPTLGVGIVGGGSGPRIRVVLVSERPL